MATAIPAWPGPWTSEINDIVKGNGALGPENGMVKKLSTEQRATITERGKELVASLLDPGVLAPEARRILIALHLDLIDAAAAQKPAIQKLMENPGYRPPSALHGTCYNAALELIVAKALWQTGHTEILPWPVEGTAAKPDFVIDGRHPSPTGHDDKSFYAACTVVADTLKVGGCKTVQDLVTGLVSGVTNKLGTYQGKTVGVVLEAADNPCLYEDGELRTDDEDIIDAFQERIEGLDAGIRQRLLFVYVVLPRAAVVTMDETAWR
ncbi:hypothetical protein [Streptomyces sp. NPDC016675]|uniref:hypothetical protein n=1 Tax=Streptomyces sp. NPDC016675 TaxID=3364970 RepID=UPI0036F89E16